jgi:hypothetical protein
MHFSVSRSRVLLGCRALSSQPYCKYVIFFQLSVFVTSLEASVPNGVPLMPNS